MDTVLHFRLTTPMTAKEVNDGIIEALSPSCKKVPTLVESITGSEIGRINKEPHTHSAIYTNLSRETAKDRLKKYFKVNKSLYSLKVAVNPTSNLSYCTKMGNISYSKGFEQNVMEIDEIVPWVFNEQDLSDQVKELDDTYLDSTMDDDSYLNSLLAIYAEKGPKNLYLHHLKSHWVALFNRRNLQGTQRIYSDPEDNTRYVVEPFNPRQVLVDNIKKFIVN